MLRRNNEFGCNINSDGMRIVPKAEIDCIKSLYNSIDHDPEAVTQELVIKLSAIRFEYLFIDINTSFERCHYNYDHLQNIPMVYVSNKFDDEEDVESITFSAYLKDGKLIDAFWYEWVTKHPSWSAEDLTKEWNRLYGSTFGEAPGKIWNSLNEFLNDYVQELKAANAYREE
jgi:hypothetical protein